MARYVCERCKTEYHVVGGLISGTNDTEHLCADLKKRWERREKQRDAVLALLYDHHIECDDIESLAEEIVMTLVKLQINVED